MFKPYRVKLSEYILDQRDILGLSTDFIHISYHTFVEIHSLLHASVKGLEYNLCRL